MKMLMLRGQVPQDRNPKEIVFDKIEDCDDMWTQLFFEMSKGHEAQLWYWGGNRNHCFSDHFTERWMSSFKVKSDDFIPDLIFARGGFPQYHCVLKRFPAAYKIYYGAGRRYLPRKGFSDYDLVLLDSSEQLEDCKRKFPHLQSSLFIKPAADNLFFPIESTEKEFDICFPANGRQPFKGHDFIYKTSPSHLKILNLGNSSKVPSPPNVTSFRVIRTEMNKHMQRCKVGIAANKSEVDSCPRVIPEMLAAGLPIICLDRIKFWRSKYITSETGSLARPENFWETVEKVISFREDFSPRRYYDENLSLSKASLFLNRLIEETM